MNYISEVKRILSEKFNNQPRANVVTFGCAQNENDSELYYGEQVGLRRWLHA